ncbi:hypothetical protein N431DRAFT_400640 [Stipitochalara longipes BDJ]|nr:hypothetical protein N431DRAFT_400640 [Stipitochalara longipes BDJ]
MVPSIHYEKLRDLEDSETILSNKPQQPFFPRCSTLAPSTFKTVLLLSLICNTLLLPQVVYFWGKHGGFCKEAPLTEYVELKTDILVPFNTGEGSLYDPVWNSPQMSDTIGVVALGPEYIKAKNLPRSMRFPWDESKHVYVLSFHHNIHCLRYLRQSVLESHTGREQSMNLEHLGHCLNVLREDTMCHADDTPRYTGRLHTQANLSHYQAGIDQTRKCRDFDKLYEWSIEHTACYGDVGPNAAPEEYFKNCPDGRKPWE